MNLTIEFLLVEETPLLQPHQRYVALTTAALTLVIGILVNVKVFRLLRIKQRNRTNSVINNLYLTYNVTSLILHPPLLVYVMLKSFVFPMKDLIGRIGCGFSMLGLDIYVRFLALEVPFLIALIRYLFVTQSYFLKPENKMKATKFISALAVILPVLVTLFTQFPIEDFPQGPYNFCLGRFEVYYNPLHNDTTTPGRRAGLDICDIHTKYAFDGDTDLGRRMVWFVLMCLCHTSRSSYILLSTSLPEAVLYILTFWHLKKATNKIASSGVLRPEAMRMRRQQNTFSIYYSLAAWFLQFWNNSFQIFSRIVFFGTNYYLHALFAIFTLTFNFAILPFLYMVAGSDDVKSHLKKFELKAAFQAFYNI